MSDLKRITVNPNRPEIRALADEILVEYVEALGFENALAVSIVVIANLLIAVLHSPAPMPEQNVAEVRKFLDSLREQVMHHEECAYEINEVDRKPTVH